MNQFYVSIIFLGIMLIAISLIWIIYDRKKSVDYTTQLDAKKEELIKVISDSEVMLQELNKFSDYVVTQISQKNEELGVNLKTVDEKLKAIEDSIRIRERLKTMQHEKAVNGNVVDMRVRPDSMMVECDSDLAIGNIGFASDYAGYVQPPKAQPRVREKVIPLNSRHKEVIQLSQNGMSDTEIARKLSMGKGEIQLILGMNK